MFAKIRTILIDVYDLFELSLKAFRGFVSRPFYLKEVIYQMQDIGLGSLLIVLLTSFVTGMILALMSGLAMARFGAKMYVGTVVSLTMVLELGPVLTGIVVAGRVGAGIAAELGSMKVTEQIDAMRALATDPIRKLVSTRLLAGLVMIPALVVVADIMGILGGLFVAVMQLGVNSVIYRKTVIEALNIDFLRIGLIKPFFFAAIIVLIGCFTGLTTSGGTAGVGRATTKSVVISSILIIVSDYFLTQLLIWILDVTL